MKDLGYKLELLANTAIVAVAILVTWATYKDHQVAKARDFRPQGIAVGATVALSGVSWSAKQQTLILALSTQCHFCAESGPFYKTLTTTLAGRRDLQFVAVFPQPTDEAHDYLGRRGIEVAQVVQQSLSSIPVTGTPTLLLVDQFGRVVKKWNGKLAPEQETTVWTSLGCAGPERCFQ